MPNCTVLCSVGVIRTSRTGSDFTMCTVRHCVLLAAALLASGGPAFAVQPDRTTTITFDPAHELVPISKGLGLADVIVRLPVGAYTAVNAEVSPSSRVPQGHAASFIAPLVRRVPVDATAKVETDTFSVRIWTGQAAFTLRLVATTPDGKTVASAPVECEITPKFETPDWAKGAVWYQVFPERFRNGNSANDPNGKGIWLSPWNADWYTIQKGELEAWYSRREMNPDTRQRGGGDLYKVIFDRRYGGDLQGLEQKLPDLADLGITALYLNPIFQARSLHKYDASDFRHIDDALANPAGPSLPIDEKYYTPPPGETDDPTTWTWTGADTYFTRQFLPAVRRADLRIVLDGVWNHVGFEFWAFNDMRRNGRASHYADWFIAEFKPDGALDSWSGWERKNGYLPEFRQVKGVGRDWDASIEKGDINAGAKKHVFDVTKRWMDPDGNGNPDDGIDGWRLDVAGEVGEKFWSDWRSHVRAINPEAITIAEIWSKAGDLTGRNIFDTQMHYPFAYPVLEWLTNKQGDGRPISSAELVRRLNEAFGNDLPQTQLVHQNLFASHDTDRYVNMLWNPGRGGYNQNNRQQNRDDFPRGAGYQPYKAGRPPRETYDLSIVGLAIQATYIGAPMIYYGDEFGMWGANDPNCRKPVPWADTPTNENADDAIVPGHAEKYKQWLTLRADAKMGPILRLGDLRHLQSPEDIFAFERSLNGDRIIVIANRSDAAFDASALLVGARHDTPIISARSVRTYFVPASK